MAKERPPEGAQWQTEDRDVDQEHALGPRHHVVDREPGGDDVVEHLVARIREGLERATDREADAQALRWAREAATDAARKARAGLVASQLERQRNAVEVVAQ